MDRSLTQKNTVLSVSQLNREVQALLEKNFFSIHIEGEISNLSRPSSGHLYFSLKDARAQVRCALFRRQAQQLKMTLENGLQVQARANVSLYETRGDYQLIINSLEETGDGVLRRAFEQLKDKLAMKGFFAPEHKKVLPLIPQCIGIITSPSGAAIRDILSVLRRRFPSIPVIIYPVMVQGHEAKYEINQAIITANHNKDCDILLLARGGGSIEDLWAFNEEMVAKAIYKSKIPIVSGIGHETDTTIADYVADLRAATPTAAAEHSTPDAQQWLAQFQAYRTRLNQLIQHKLSTHQQRLNWLSKNLNQQHPNKQLENKAQRLDELELRLKSNLQNRLRQAKSQLHTHQAHLWQHNPKHQVQQLKNRYNAIYTRLTTNIKGKLQKEQQRFILLSQSLHIVSPLATLQRGYSLTSYADKLLHNSHQVKIGDKIHTQLTSGKIISEIQEITHE